MREIARKVLAKAKATVSSTVGSTIIAAAVTGGGILWMNEVDEARKATHRQYPDAEACETQLSKEAERCAAAINENRPCTPKLCSADAFKQVAAIKKPLNDASNILPAMLVGSCGPATLIGLWQLARDGRGALRRRKSPSSKPGV